MARDFIPSPGLIFRSHDSPFAGGITAADQLFFNLDGRILCVADDAWRLEVCGVHTSGAKHWVQLHVHGARECGLTLRAESLDPGHLLRRVDAWLCRAMETRESSACTAGD